MEDPKQRVFWWFFRPFIRRRREDNPEGVSDDELIRRGDAIARRPFLLLLGCLAIALLAWSLVGLHDILGLGPRRADADIYCSRSTVWPGAIFMAMGLSCLMTLLGMRLFGSDEDDGAFMRGFSARYRVSARGAYALISLLLFAMGGLFMAAGGDYVAFDGRTLRWLRSYTEHARPLADIAEVRWYHRKETPRGGPREWRAACVLFKDGTFFLSTDGFFTVALPPAACSQLAEAAGAPAYLNLDVLDKDELGR